MGPTQSPTLVPRERESQQMGRPQKKKKVGNVQLKNKKSEKLGTSKFRIDVRSNSSNLFFNYRLSDLIEHFIID